jgi:hypothetical protein
MRQLGLPTARWASPSLVRSASRLGRRYLLAVALLLTQKARLVELEPDSQILHRRRLRRGEHPAAVRWWPFAVRMPRQMGHEAAGPCFLLLHRYGVPNRGWRLQLGFLVAGNRHVHDLPCRHFASPVMPVPCRMTTVTTGRGFRCRRSAPARQQPLLRGLQYRQGT